MKKLAVLFIVLAGCAGAPEVAPRKPWFDTNPDLLEKEKAHYKYTMGLLNNQGLLLYRGWLPLSNQYHYVESHNIADAPAWHAYIPIALAFKEAVTGEDTDEDMLRVAQGLEKFFDVTGVRGLIGRTYLVDYKGPRLPWMKDKTIRPTRFWLQNDRGEWWRNGVAKDHWNHAIVGCAVPLTLHRNGEIELSKETHDTLVRILVDMTNHLVGGGFRIRDWDGRFSEFGDLRPYVAFGPKWPQIGILPNGFNMAVVLNALKSAGHYDDDLRDLYEDKIKEWSGGVGLSMQATGEFVAAIGHDTLDGRPTYGDMQGFALATLSLLLQEFRREYVKDFSRAMNGIWKFAQYERHATVVFPYAGVIRKKEGMKRVAEVLQDLRDFPMPRDKRAFYGEVEDTNKIQPLANRETNTNYWKGTPFRRMKNPQKIVTHPETGGERYYAASDYLIAYWMGRYFKLIPER